MDADNKPRAIASKAVAAKSTAVVDLDYEMLLTNSQAPRAIQIRIGPARPGQIFINGDAKGANDKAPPAFIEVMESRAGWRLKAMGPRAGQERCNGNEAQKESSRG